MIYTRMEHLLYRIYPRLMNFPKAERYSLTQDIKQNFFDFLRYIALADKVRSKRLVYAQEADGHLQTLKVLTKLANKRRYISKGFYAEISLELTEISKMLAGYIRSVNK